ncbi:uncharacterized protein L201_002513 [Kwoniella dendrophila CBS 6074]|uniref:Uncharacterized protein n=1 Tax=Kwoniella dendrophila CBS 6074 TaxID=1295534 RepID=A0AAX4JRT8_9TREE
MFAPRSTHLPRTYSVYQQPTTTKKNTNKENANALPSKTPSRLGKSAIMPTTGMRMGLGVKTEGRDRNVLMQQQQAGGAGEGKGKGKGKEGDDIEPKRLFGHGPSKSMNSIPPSKSLSSMPHIQVNHIQQSHKTPAKSIKKKQMFQALRTPAPAPTSVLTNEPAPTPLPSATRQRRRSRQSLSNISLTPIKSAIIKASQPEQSFVTPAPTHMQWEEELSLGSIEETTNEVLQGVIEENEVEDDDGEPEYMPPPVEELPWTPAYDHPDLTAIFSTLSALPPLWSYSDDVIIKDVPAFEIEELDVQSIKLKSDDDLEEDWLKPKTKPVVQAIQVKSNLTNRSGTTISRPIPPRTSNGSRPAVTTIPSIRPTTSRMPSTLVKSTMTPSIRSKPPAPVPRPPPTQRNISARTVPSKGIPNQPIKKTRTVSVVHPADKALFASWEKQDALDEGFELNLELNLDEIDEGKKEELDMGDLKVSE